MFSTLAIVGTHLAGPVGGFHWALVLIPIFWILVFVLLAGIVGLRWRRAAWSGHANGYGHGPWGANAARSAEATLAERFAQGEIDEKEYRARLEVLRANAFPSPPAKK